MGFQIVFIYECLLVLTHDDRRKHKLTIMHGNLKKNHKLLRLYHYLILYYNANAWNF